MEEAFIIVISRPSICELLAFRRSLIPVIPRNEVLVAFTRISEAFPRLTLLAKAVVVAKSEPDLKATVPVMFNAAKVDDAALICR